MNDENSPGIPWVVPEEGICELYSNIIHVNWAAYDLRVRFGRLIVEDKPEGARWKVSEEAAVTMSYGQAKYLRNLLHGIIKDYEEKNGEINISPAWPAPTAALEPK